MEKQFEVIWDGRKISSLTIEGKPVAMRDITKACNTSYWRKWSEGITVNPYTGARQELSALLMSLYQWCVIWYSRYSTGQKTEVPLQTYDSIKYLILKINEEAYMKLID